MEKENMEPEVDERQGSAGDPAEEDAAGNDENIAPGEESGGFRQFLSDAVEILESTIITVFSIVLIFTYLLHPVNVVGESMVPTLNDGDKIFMSMVNPNISYGDIVIINNDASYLLDSGSGSVVRNTSAQFNECIIKRVIATGGQTLDIDFEKGEVTVDGEVLNEPYINDLTTIDLGAFSYPLTVPDGYYFVMGDNRNRSTDSRSPYVGLVKKDQIYGKAVIRYSPLSEFKIL